MGSYLNDSVAGTAPQQGMPNLTVGQLINATQKQALGSPLVDPADAIQTATNAGGMAASTAYLQNMANGPNASALEMTPQFQSAASNQDAHILDAEAGFKPRINAANNMQASALSQLQNTAAGGGPSVAALQQQQGLGQAQQAGANVASQMPSRTGGSAASQFLNMLNAQNTAASNAVNQGAQGKLQEQLGAAQGANSLANQYTNNLVNTAATNTQGVANYTNALNNTTALQGKQVIGAGQASNAYLAGLANTATGGASAALTDEQNKNAYNGAISSGLGTGIGTLVNAYSKQSSSNS